jgi:predicted acyl esterase
MRVTPGPARLPALRGILLGAFAVVALPSLSAVGILPSSGSSPRSGAVVSGGTSSVSCPLGLRASAELDPAGGRPFTVCAGYVTSFDGTPLSTDVTIPDGAKGPLPLVVMLNGWGSNKSNFEATRLGGNGSQYTYHWNNAWFASQGFAVLNYTARGFWHSCGKVPISGAPSEGGITASEPVYLSEAGCAGRESWTHLADRKWEIRDTETLVGKLVDAGIANPDKVVVTGDSYGGGQSWTLAMAEDKVMRRNGTLVSWKSPDGTPIRLAAAVPLFGWTDLLQALVDNGNASIVQYGGRVASPPAGSHSNPYGVEKASYVSGLFALGEATAQYAPPGVDPGSDLTSWYAAVSAGEPYGANPVVGEAVSAIDSYRSAWYMPVPPPKLQVPIFSVQGLTDPLFPAVQSLQMEQRLRARYPNYPVWTVLADVGHSYADNPPAVWHRILDQANTWLEQVLRGQQPKQPKIEVATVACASGQETTWYAADHLREIPNAVLAFTGSGLRVTTSVAADPVANVETDPIATSGCRTLPSEEVAGPGIASYTFSPPEALASHGVTLMGAPVVKSKVRLLGKNAEIAVSLWQVSPSAGTETLVTRCVKRLVGRPGEVLSLDFELWPTAWYVAPGEEVQLQLTQSDAPTWRPDNLPSGLVFTHLRLLVPAISAK